MVRERNFFFDYAAISRVQKALSGLGETSALRESVDDLYSAILRCFYEHGKVSKPRIPSTKQEPWMTFLSSDELEVRSSCGPSVNLVVV